MFHREISSSRLLSGNQARWADRCSGFEYVITVLQQSLASDLENLSDVSVKSVAQVQEPKHQWVFTTNTAVKLQ